MVGGKKPGRCPALPWFHRSEQPLYAAFTESYWAAQRLGDLGEEMQESYPLQCVFDRLTSRRSVQKYKTSFPFFLFFFRPFCSYESFGPLWYFHHSFHIYLYISIYIYVPGSNPHISCVWEGRLSTSMWSQMSTLHTNALTTAGQGCEQPYR